MTTREITITEANGKFSLLGKDKINYNFSGISALRKLLGNEKARLLNYIKIKKPSSLYGLSKQLGRNFKSVYEDVKLLKRFGFIEIVEEKKNNRICHRPKLVSNTITIHIHI